VNVLLVTEIEHVLVAALMALDCAEVLPVGSYALTV
jgi:hypothetical protein